MAGEAVAVERDRQRQADQAAAEDDDVRALHAPPLADFPAHGEPATAAQMRPDAALQRPALDPESAEAHEG